MPLDFEQVAIMTAASLAPFTPYLIDLGKAAGKKLTEVIAQKGGEAGWEQAKAIWEKLIPRAKVDRELESAVMMLAAKPDDNGRRLLLAEVLVTTLKSNPALAQEILNLLSRHSSIQAVRADEDSIIEDAIQVSSNPVDQIVEAKDHSTIRRVYQRNG